MKEKITCFVCNQELDTDEYNHDNKTYCENCYNEYITICDRCGDNTHIDNIQEVEGEKQVCNACLMAYYTRCSHCDTYVSDFTVTAGGYSICNNCYEGNYFTCDYCGRVIHNDDYGEDGYCQGCCRSENLLEYNYKPVFNFYGKPRNDLFFGIELEIENIEEEESIDNIVDNLHHSLYAKEDGSLDNGFEIVSHPASFKWIKENLKHWRKVFDLSKQGFRSYQTDTCGMHVHMSRKAFGTLQLYKLLKIFYENPKFILIMSRRSRMHQLKRYSSLTSDESLIIKARKPYENDYGKRYTAVNLCNPDTIEIRIFRGTLAEIGFMRNLEFCKAVYDFTKRVSIKNCSPPNLIKHVINSKQYPNLHKFIIDKDLAKELKQDYAKIEQDYIASNDLED